MSATHSDESLHFPSLSIKEFRGIGDLHIPRMGRVTLIAGENGVGKTSVLEACRIYAEGGRFATLADLSGQHEEYSTVADEDGDKVIFPDPSTLFYGREIAKGSCIKIGPGRAEGGDCLKIQATRHDTDQASAARMHLPDKHVGDRLWTLSTSFRGQDKLLPWLFAMDDDGVLNAVWSTSARLPFRGRARRWIEHDKPMPVLGCVSLGPGLMANNEMAMLWNDVALTPHEELMREALQLGLGSTVKRVAMLLDAESRFSPLGQRAVVLLQGHNRPVPLKSLGDGAARFFCIALALANSSNGFLLIDEAENGVHYSVQKDFWSMILKVANRNCVQVLATTHSGDCIRGFAQAAQELGRGSGVLVRLDKENGHIRAVEYSEDELSVATEQGIEVR